MVRNAREVCLRFVVAVAALASLASCNDNVAAQQQQTPRAKPKVTAQTLQSQEVTLTTELPGRTAAHLVSQVRPRVSGIIRERTFVEGGMVRAGDLLYELDSTSFEAALRSAQAVLKRAEGAVPSAQARFDRYRSLSRNNVVSRQDFDEAQSQMLQAEADVAAASAAVETARINLDYTKVRAPIDGKIDASNVTPGALVTENQEAPLTTIHQIDVINVDLVRTSASLLWLNKERADGLRSNGDSVTVELLLEDGTHYPYPGKLQFRNAAVSSSTGMVSFRAIFPNPEGMLLPGMYVRALVEDGYVQDGFLLPQRTVSRNARGEATAKFVDANMKVEERILPVVQSVGNNWLVRSGVTNGDRIVVEGAQRASAGQEVEVTSVTVDDQTGEVRQAAEIVPATATDDAGNLVSVRKTVPSVQ
ncbi:efflux RND transporter periplasmic adaptor subunit [Rhizobium leguminosarum]|uniref:efflux RND transporter periplasmic adaptor subunit n=1 Tax=Rhizobium leguminosarum TaxID=384 RepID=UPI001C957CA4|nr:efflux RND transporter periplasmic adaptor subunit [Rhizobium leguminosarum]MBY5775031.1 efflux RND transporter periplasmic adaptor subunit [Rhizobium leguminosarum]